MNRIITLLVISFFAINVFEQEDKNYDVVLKLSGDEHIGTVSEMDDNVVKFVRKGELLSYTFKKAEIMKITFSSGRIKIINDVSEKKEGENQDGELITSFFSK